MSKIATKTNVDDIQQHMNNGRKLTKLSKEILYISIWSHNGFYNVSAHLFSRYYNKYRNCS
jgi:hypothetical protein